MAVVYMCKKKSYPQPHCTSPVVINLAWPLKTKKSHRLLFPVVMRVMPSHIDNLCVYASCNKKTHESG